jgi:molecular chaperone GrpE
MDLKDLFRRRGKHGTTMNSDHTVNEHTPEQATAMEQADPQATANADTEISNADNGSVAELQGELDALRAEHQALHDKHVRLYAEFDNFRKRTARERLELIQTAGEGTLKTILPVLDDLERAVVNNEKAEDLQAVKEGVKLIHQKFLHLLSTQGLKVMEDPKGQPFDTDRHEAITQAPAPDDSLKGKVIDVVEQGYLLHDKVIRYAKVVVGI